VPKTSLIVEEILTLLPQGPQRVAFATAGLTEVQLHSAASEGEWSANDVLAHLRACADVWGNCIARMLAEDSPTLKAVNPRTWIKSTDYLDLDFEPSLRAYTTQRAALLATLNSLPPEAWSRGATVKGAGKPLQRTVHSCAESIAIHERAHIKQIERIAKAINK
jgi:hypothetical protein